MGKLRKLGDADINSETRSIYKLDPNNNNDDVNYDSVSNIYRNIGQSSNLDKIFKGMEVADRS